MEVVRYTPRELVERIRAGERSIEDALVRQYSRGVQFAISQSVSDGSVVEDLYQECFRMVLEKVRAGEVNRSEEHTSELQSLRHLVDLHSFPTRRSSDLFAISQSVSDGSVVEDLYQECFRMVLEKVRAGEVN